MATYAKEKGFTVQTLSSDPAASIAASGSWSTGGSMNTGRQSPFSNGTQSAAWCAGGYSTAKTAVNEHYNGTSWTEVADLNTARLGISGGAGTTTAGLVAGGDLYPSPRQTALTESWNGSAWTEVNDLNTARQGSQMVGQVYTAALFGGGLTSDGSTYQALTEKWDGTSWTESGDLNTARWGIQGSGTSTAASFNGGDNPSGNNIANLEQFDGSSWTETTDSNNVRRLGGSSVGSPYNDFIVFGGHVGEPESASAATEFWNGTAWTELNDLGTAMTNLGGAGTSSSGLSFAGTPQITQTEEWTTTPSATFNQIHEGQLYFNSTSNAFKETITDIPSTTWASGGNMNTSVQHRQSAGITTAAIAYSGTTSGGRTANVEQYDGSSWTEVGDVNVARSQAAGTPASPYSSAMFFAGDSGPPNTNQATAESWNGSAWTEVGDLNTARTQTCGTGASNTAAICVAGSDNPNQSPIVAVVEQYDGSSWTEVGDVNTARRENPLCTGTSTSSIFAGGYASGGDTNKAESWDGTSWTEVGDMNTTRAAFGGGGANNASSLGVGGNQGDKDQTEIWNGSSWTELNDLSTGRSSVRSAGSASNCIANGGYTTTYSNLTEEWTSDLANKTITSS